MARPLESKMTAERLHQLRGLGETVSWMEDGEWAEILDLAAWALVQRENNRKRVAAVRQSKSAEKPKTAQRGQKAAKKAPVLESADTVEAVQEKLAQVTKPILPLTGPEIPGEAPHREKYVKPAEPKPAPSALPKAFWGSLDRVKTPGQIAHDPAATQFKTAKPKKP
jgi:hypothetical protein